MADLISKPLRAFLDAADGYWSITEKERSRLIYLNSNALRVHGFKDLNSAEGRELEEIKSSLANYAVTFREQNELILSSAEPREFFDTHFCGDNQWHCFHGRKEPFYADDDNDAEHDAPYTDESIAGVTYHGTDISAPHTIDLASVLARHAVGDGFVNHIKEFDGSYEINCEHTRLQLNDREASVLYLSIHGASNKKISRALQLSERTIDDYISRLATKMRVKGRSDLAWKANTNGYHNTIPRSFLTNKQSSVMLRECLPEANPWWFFEQIHAPNSPPRNPGRRKRGAAAQTVDGGTNPPTLKPPGQMS